jgi:hypothetical protein
MRIVQKKIKYIVHEVEVWLPTHAHTTRASVQKIVILKNFRYVTNHENWHHYL